MSHQLMDNSFIHPQNVDEGLKEEFMRACKSAKLPEIADEVMNKAWLDKIKFKVESHRICFLNGDKDPGVSTKLFIQTKSNFPGADIRIVKDWKLYPMLEQSTFFKEYLVNDLLSGEKKNENILSE
ncbi:MAG: hypothetical protein HC917_20895 [Richelia sp. SM2_1_7]|nr:hypothetical protein [Richelia sp. SM2_1_7]